MKYKTEYEYSDDVLVNTKCGSAQGADGYDRKDKKDADWFSEACGENGGTPLPLFKVMSVKLNFLNCQIVTGNGGSGVNTTYAALWHIPFIGSGDGGHGGDGGNGRSLCSIDKGRILVSSSKFKAGHGGKAGKGSKVNPNYWLWSGSDDKDGKRGCDSSYLVGSDGEVGCMSDKLCVE